MAILITGAAGFVGSNLASVLISQGKTVFGVDNLCRGSIENLDSIINNESFKLSIVDMSDLDSYRESFRGFNQAERITEIWHLAANSDIPAGVENAHVDLKDTFMSTFNTLELVKEFNIPVLAFASSSAIYGDLGSAPLVEDIGPLLPISNYGAMKLASEAIISAAVESYLDRAFIFRFPNVIGVPATHGVMLDFVRKLAVSPDNLNVLGDGTQQKGYLHVEELIDAMLYIRAESEEKIAVFNIGAGDEGVTVRFIAEETVKACSPSARITYGEGNRGWVGDVPRFVYSIKKLRLLGWTPKMDSASAVRKAVQQIVEQESL